MIDVDKIKKLTEQINAAEDHILKRFVANAFIDELTILQNENLTKIFELCSQFGVRYIKIHPFEICGCEDKRVDGWPAMWKIAELLNIDGGCGNTDQYQTRSGKWFPDDAYGQWDVMEKRKLFLDEIMTKNFRSVVSRIK